MKTGTNWAALLVLGIWLMGCQSTGAPNETGQKAFHNRFGNVKDVKWTHNPDFSYAHFTQNGKSVIAVFGNDGQFMETELAKPTQ